MNNLEQQIEAQREVKALMKDFIDNNGKEGSDERHNKVVQAMRAYNKCFKCNKYNV
jgi:hypothetical protein